MEQKEVEDWLNLLEKQFVGSQGGLPEDLVIARHKQLSGSEAAQAQSFEEGARIMAYV
jgi:hypothetical protein